MGHIADTSSMRAGFVVPLVCFVVIAIYGAIWQRLEYRDASTPAGDATVKFGTH